MKHFLSVFTVLVMGLSAMAGEIVHTYHFGQPQFDQKAGYDVVRFNNTMMTNRAGEPLLPYHAIQLLLPAGEEAVAITVKKEGKVSIDGTFSLYPAQASRPLSKAKSTGFQKNEAVYASQTPYPAEEVRFSTHYLNGHGFVFAAISPLEYVPADGKLSYYEHITVTVQTKPVKNASQLQSMLKSSPEVIETVSRLAQNPDMLSSYTHRSRQAGDFELLIITPQSYAGAFEPLTSLYLSKGDRSQIVTTEYIAANITGSDLQQKIRNLIIQKYQENQIETVLLGGDVELVPYRGFYCYVQSGSGYTDNGIPADLYYSGLDGNWNTDGDTKWGEIGEDDLLPDVGIGRLPFSNATELASLLNKSIKYQTQPVLGEFTKTLLAGEHLYDNPNTEGSDYLDLLVGLRNDNGYTTNGIPANYNIQTLYDEVQYWSGADLRNAINQGKQFVHHVGHASQTYVAKWSNSDITNANFAQTNGVIHNYALFHTHGCDCGSFDYNDCILERMVNIDNFAAAVIGNSRYGWFNEGQTEGPAAHLHREMTDAIFTDRIAALGLALTEAKVMTAPWVNAPGQWEEGALRWNFYDLNILGDPALHVWSAEPRTTTVDYSPELVLGTTETTAMVSVDGLPLSNAVCSVLMNGQLIGRALTGGNGVAVIPFDVPVTEIGNAQLIISGYNCLTTALPLTFIPASGPYVVYNSFAVNDNNGGNGNGLPDYNETINLTMAMRNVGLETAQNLTVVVNTQNPHITLIDNDFNIAQLNAGDTATVNNAITLSIAHGIPDQEMVVFQMSTTDGNQTWQSSFSMIVHAPELIIGNYTINDATGNNNGLLDAGETVDLTINVSNTGSSNAAFEIQLTHNSPWVTIGSPNLMVDLLAPGQTTSHAFTLTVDAATPYGTVVPLTLHAIDGDYTVSEDWLLSVGLRIEDFENGNFNSYEWHHAGNANWSIAMVNPYEGNYCAKSGAIDHNQQSDLWISLIAMGNDEVKFARKVSSEAGYDYLRFYIDDNQIDEWSGEIAWQEMSYDITEGSHVLRWSYEKDVSVVNGSDCAWLDKITFPGTTMVIDLGEQRTASTFGIAPNPSSGKFFILTDQTNALSITIYDAKGQVVKEVRDVRNNMVIDGSQLNRGLYIIEAGDGLKTYRTKLVIE